MRDALGGSEGLQVAWAVPSPSYPPRRTALVGGRAPERRRRQPVRVVAQAREGARGGDAGDVQHARSGHAHRAFDEMIGGI